MFLTIPVNTPSIHLRPVLPPASPSLLLLIPTYTQPQPGEPTQAERTSTQTKLRVARRPADTIVYKAYSLLTRADLMAVGMWQGGGNVQTGIVPSPFKPFITSGGGGARFNPLVLSLFACATHCLPSQGATCVLPSRSAFSTHPNSDTTYGRRPTKTEHKFWKTLANIASIDQGTINGVVPSTAWTVLSEKVSTESQAIWTMFEFMFFLTLGRGATPQERPLVAKLKKKFKTLVAPLVLWQKRS